MKTIGLCLSGGGHRASIFSLGVLLYLADVDRLRDVKVISSVSGGSLTSGFFANNSNPREALTPERVEAAVASLARQISGGGLRAWWTAFVSVMLLAIAWCATLHPSVAAAIAFGPTQTLFAAMLVIAAILAARRVGGTIWAWWGTWIYLVLLILSLWAAIVVWWWPIHWIIKFLVASLGLSLHLLRGQVAERAFAATILRDNPARLLAEVPVDPRFVFCATELHSGQHAWFTSDLVYAHGFGLGKPGRVTLTTAVQASANFPPAFPHRLLNRRLFDFRLPGALTQPRNLVVTDGGVYDNTATAWFLEAPGHGDALAERLATEQRISAADWSPTLPHVAALQSQLEAMRKPRPDCLIVVNSSEPHDWKAAKRPRFPLLGEVITLARISSTLYNKVGIDTMRLLNAKFLRNPGSGAIVSIGRTERQLVATLASSGYKQIQRELGLSDDVTQRLRAKAMLITYGPDDPSDVQEKEALYHVVSELQTRIELLPADSSERVRLEMEQQKTQSRIADLEYEIVSSHARHASQALENTLTSLPRASVSASVATTFSPLGAKTTATLLAHGYLSAMSNCSFLLDFPVVKGAADLEEFDRLANGFRRRASVRQLKLSQLQRPSTR